MTENDYCLLYDIASKRIEELEKEKTELKSELTKKADTNHSLVEQMADLESENAELKGILTSVDCLENAYSFGRKEGMKQSVDQLNKAVELLKWALHSDPEHDDLVDFDTKWKEAEQFISEVEK